MSNLNYDPWQEEVMHAKGNVLLCSGRQVGKSTIIARRDGEYACNNPKKSVLIISATERQSEELFNKTLFYIQDNYKHLIKTGKERPTKHVIKLKNGSIIRSLPCGLSGFGIRGFTIDRLTADEAAFIPEAVWSAVTPMLLTTGGDIVLLSTPHGRAGYFYECSTSPDFKSFHINSEDTVRNRKITNTWSQIQHEKALEHLEREKKKMSSMEYAQEYMGEFVDDLGQLFTDKLIENVCVLKRNENINPTTNYYLGSDIARMGDDESTFEIIEYKGKDNYKHRESIITRKQFLTQTVDKIILLNQLWRFKKIGVDGRGVGAGVIDMLLKDNSTKRKVEDLDNAKRDLNRDKTKHKRLLKEDMYLNFLAMLERGYLKLLEDDEVCYSMKSVQFEYVKKDNQATRFRVFGKGTHIVEGLIRAAWLIKTKELSIWVR